MTDNAAEWEAIERYYDALESGLICDHTEHEQVEENVNGCGMRS